MKSSILKAVCVFLMGFVLMLVSGRGAAAQSEDREARLVGTWRVQVTQVDCATGAPMSPSPFSSLLTFAVGGTMAEDTTNPAFGPGQRGAGQGTWDHKDPHTYSARSVAFINYTTPPNLATHNPGFEAGEQTIAQSIRLKGDSDTWTSTATIEFADTTGTVYRQGCALASAQRF